MMRCQIARFHRNLRRQLPGRGDDERPDIGARKVGFGSVQVGLGERDRRRGFDRFNVGLQSVEAGFDGRYEEGHRFSCARFGFYEEIPRAITIS